MDSPCGATLRWGMDPIVYERRGAAALVRIVRPERRNAIDGATADALHAAFARFVADEGARVVGLGRALEMILLGRAVGSREALGFGLVNAVVPDDRAVPTALEWAELIAGFPQETMLADREAAIRGFGLTLDEGLALERRLGGATFGVGRAGAARFAAGQGRRGAGVPGFERR